ncbi:hypothetical protein [Klebsiella variicola]|uniref:hypothetical protein n=1 Tax=Klebsiella variicola TaxID=244366 RepID=UPI0011EBF9E3|nr:hypothetical protein [Klebsiella variicola]KAA0473417.1 hypothetical protein F0331_06470 [Klebsiella variicola]
MKMVFAAAFLLAFSTFALAKPGDYLCYVTHHTQKDDGSISSEFVGSNISLHDSGNSFSVIIAGQKIESPDMEPVVIDGENALAGKRGDLTFIKMNDSYTMRTKNEGYVINGCE